MELLALYERLIDEPNTTGPDMVNGGDGAAGVVMDIDELADSLTPTTLVHDEGMTLPRDINLPPSLADRSNPTQPFGSLAVKANQVHLACGEVYDLSDIYQLCYSNRACAEPDWL